MDCDVKQGKRRVRPSASGYNESQLARRCGVTAGTIHRILTGERRPGAALAVNLRRLGVRV